MATLTMATLTMGHAYCPGADSDWLGNVSLMMRTHLNGIIGMHQLLSATGLTVEQVKPKPRPPCPPSCPPRTPARSHGSSPARWPPPSPPLLPLQGALSAHDQVIR